ncbi:MAG: ATP-dependent helicase [Myxococcales bacterium]|nr:ATP-dependent helicase [Myxococcales bacterium]
MRQYTLKRETPPGRSGFLKDLNDEQRRVVEAGGGPLLVIAGAGTGKTRALTYRTAHLIEQGVAPDRIMLLTFTNKAAREMTDRVSRLLPDAATRVWAGTFHSIANRILRQHADQLGYGNNYGILDPQEARDLMDLTLARTVDDPGKRRLPKAQVLLKMLSTAVNTDRALGQVIEADHPQFLSALPIIDAVLTGYLGQKVEMNVMDYDDLLVNWQLLLSDHPELRDAWASRFQHLLVDEFQDTNLLQARIVDLMAGPGGNLMVVGDDAQSIYAFRGARVRNILDFPDRHPGTQVFRLERNYRSTPQIVAVANASIRHNKFQFEKTLRAQQADGDLPAHIVVGDGELQAAFVAQRVLELRDEGVELKQQAVLYRAHYQAMELQLELQRRGIPFTIRSGQRFFEQAHIRDVLAHLRILFNPLDRLAWMRVLKLQEGIGTGLANTIVDALSAQGDPWAALKVELGGALPKRARVGYQKARDTLLALGEPGMIGAPSSMFDYLLGQGGYADYLQRTQPNAEAREEDIRQMSHFAGRFDHYQQFLEELALVEHIAAEDIQGSEPTDEKLLLSTVHQAKGLEWDAVFVLALADGQFPLRLALRSEAEEEEERRLFYVALTRARERLEIVCTRGRESRFLGEAGIRVLSAGPAR